MRRWCKKPRRQDDRNKHGKVEVLLLEYKAEHVYRKRVQQSGQGSDLMGFQRGNDGMAACGAAPLGPYGCRPALSSDPSL